MNARPEKGAQEKIQRVGLTKVGSTALRRAWEAVDRAFAKPEARERFTFGDAAEAEHKSMRKADRVLSKALELWQERGLDVTIISEMTYSRGMITVHVRSSAIVYEWDRRFRGGLFAETCAAVPGTLRRIRVRV